MRKTMTEIRGMLRLGYLGDTQVEKITGSWHSIWAGGIIFADPDRLLVVKAMSMDEIH